MKRVTKNEETHPTKSKEVVAESQTSLISTNSTATTMEARENELIALAYSAAEERIRNGKASSAEIVHFLNLGSTKSRYEQESLNADIALKKAKVDAIHQTEVSDKLYKEAIEAMKKYSGRD